MAGFQALRVDPDQVPPPEVDPPPTAAGPQTAVLAGGCFWCTEAVFKELDGVSSVRAGYAGGTADSADYDAVCSGATDHAEAIEITFDPARTSFGEILRIFFSVAHDPTQMNRQGNDRGRQYRSAIFPADELQERVARAYIAQLDRAQVYSAPIKTRIEQLRGFFAAEAVHQDYAARNPRQGYIVNVAKPKIDAMRKFYAARLQRR